MEETLGQRIERLRKRAALGQKELGRRVGLSESAVSNLESGKVADLKLPVAIRMAQVFGISVEELHAGSPAMDLTKERLCAARAFIAETPPGQLRAISALKGMLDLTDPRNVATIIAYVEANPGLGFPERIAMQRCRRSPAAYARLCVNIYQAWRSNADLGLTGYEEEMAAPDE